MLGAIAGDVIGSVYEGALPGPEDFPLFHASCFPTDDSVLTIAVAEAILDGEPYLTAIRRWALRHPDAGYGVMFHRWMVGDVTGPYNSYGNGSAMRVSPAAWIHDTLEATLAEAQRTSEVTHDHPEGIRGAQAVAGRSSSRAPAAAARACAGWSRTGLATTRRCRSSRCGATRSSTRPARARCRRR